MRTSASADKRHALHLSGAPYLQDKRQSKMGGPEIPPCCLCLLWQGLTTGTTRCSFPLLFHIATLAAHHGESKPRPNPAGFRIGGEQPFPAP